MFCGSQTKIIKWPIGTKKIRSHRQLKELPKAREDAGNQVVIGFSFGSDWLREWCEFSGKITTKAKTNAIPDYFRHPIKGCSVSKTLRYNTFPPPPPLTHLTPPTWSSHAMTSLVKEQGKKVMLKPCKQKRVMSHQDLKPHRKPRIRDHIWGREKEEYKAD